MLKNVLVSDHLEAGMKAQRLIVNIKHQTSNLKPPTANFNLPTMQNKSIGAKFADSNNRLTYKNHNYGTSIHRFKF
jgi:hypothetical protein